MSRIDQANSFLKMEQESAGSDLCYGNVLELVERLTQGELNNGFNNVRRITRQRLIDRLHFVNFSEGEIRLIFRHPKYNEMITRLVTPQPCQGEKVLGRWRHSDDYSESLEGYQLLGFLIENKRECIIAQSNRLEFNEREIALTLPEYGHEIVVRKVNRYPCRDIQAQLIQNGIIFSGRLAVFSIHSFLVEIFSGEGTSLKWINNETPGQIIFRAGEDIVYSGKCLIVKQRGNLQSKSLVLQPLSEPINRFKRREFRAPRQVLHPAPAICCIHPLIKKLIRLNICDLSTSGFSVEEDQEDSTLLPGLIIPEIHLELAYSKASTCKAQVIYNNRTDETTVKSGFSILNMSNEAYISLTNLVNKSMNRHLDICGAIELDSLWDFFFQSGFIYPQKYNYIQQNKTQFKALYEKLYLSPKEIERHITYRERGSILGHISMLHLYETTWMLHHFVTTPQSRHKRVALTLLQHIERYILDSHNFESAQMDNLICYFRPDNKFPNLVFGGAARVLKDPQICSLDRFAYIPYPMILNRTEGGLPAQWELIPSEPDDLVELAYFYKHTSGGQMIKALDLQPEHLETGRISRVFEQAGFQRERRLFSLKKSGEIKALFSLLKTDEGLNLSDLTNCLSVFVLESQDLPFEIFLRALSQMSQYDHRPKIPVLLYPLEYADRNGIAYERIYDLWVFVVENSDAYFKYMNKLFSRLLT
jgi:hypothetical protein